MVGMPLASSSEMRFFAVFLLVVAVAPAHAQTRAKAAVQSTALPQKVKQRAARFVARAGRASAGNVSERKVNDTTVLQRKLFPARGKQVTESLSVGKSEMHYVRRQEVEVPLGPKGAINPIKGTRTREHHVSVFRSGDKVIEVRHQESGGRIFKRRAHELDSKGNRARELPQYRLDRSPDRDY